jgi:hypothetical protein
MKPAHGICNGAKTGRPYDTAQCRICWLAANDPAYRAWSDPPEPVKWPWIARMIAGMRIPEDKGIGDTVARHLGRFGGDGFKRIYKRLTGSECGCANRQQVLNQLYRYA